MMEAKHPFCPIFIKQEPRDPCSDNDSINCNATNLSRNSTTAVASSSNSSNSSSSLSRLHDGPVDLRAISAVTRDPQPWSSLDALILPTSAGTGVWRRGGGGRDEGSPRVFPEGSSSIRTSRHPLANDATTMKTSDPDLPRPGGRPGKITPREDCSEGSRASDFSCVACFHDVLGQCAHRLRSNNNTGSGMLRDGCSVVSQLGAGDRATFEAADEDLAARGSKEHNMDDDDLLRESLVGLGSEGEVATFMCEDCDMRFSSRDTYAMHMLLRAKNEACSPAAPQRGNGSGSGKSDVPTTAGGTQIAISPAATTVVSSSAAAVLLGKHLPADPKQEENGDFPSLNGGSSLFGEPVRRKVSDPAFCLGLGLGLDAGRSVDYRGSWWSKYLPDGAEGVAIGSDAEGPVTHLPLVCYLCGELFSNRDSLAMHVLFHTRDTPSATHTSSTDSNSQWHKPLRADSLFLLSHGTYSGAPIRLRQPPTSIAETIPAVPTVGASTSGSGSTSHISTSASSLTSESLVRKVGGEARSATSGGEDERDGGGVFAEETARQELPHVEVATPLQGAASKSSGVAVALDNQTPQVRGRSAPAAATTSERVDREYGGLAVTPRPKASTPDLVKPRPLSADHVVGSRVLGVSRRSLQEELAWDKNMWKNPLDSHLLGGNPFLGGGIGVQLEPARASCGVYRLDRLRKLRTGRGGVYGRAPARGRPPMTIHGVVGPSRHYRPDAFPSTPTSDPPFSLGSMSFSRLPTVPTSFGPHTSSSSAPPSTRLASMLKLLTSHDHEVSACLHCEVIFAERTLHQLHMGLHNVNNPWQCNACGQVCTSRLHFATHALHF